MPDLNPEVLQLDFSDVSVGIADVDGFPMPVEEHALHAVSVVLP